MFIYFFIAQLVEQRTVNPWVTRSNRVEEASFIATVLGYLNLFGMDTYLLSGINVKHDGALLLIV